MNTIDRLLMKARVASNAVRRLLPSFVHSYEEADQIEADNDAKYGKDKWTGVIFIEDFGIEDEKRILSAVFKCADRKEKDDLKKSLADAIRASDGKQFSELVHTIFNRHWTQVMMLTGGNGATYSSLSQQELMELKSCLESG